MTLNELVEYAAEELSLPSPEAKSRLARELNARYKRVTSAIGMSPTRRTDGFEPATVGDRFVTFTDVEKLEAVYLLNGNVKTTLMELTNDEMRDLTPRDEPPTQYSIYSMTPTTITIQLDCIPATAFNVYATALSDATTLSNNDQPNFPESFHDVLIHGVRADEYRRKEKLALVKEAEQMYEQRLSDLKMFLAKSAYLDVYRGKHTPVEGWWDVYGVTRSGIIR